MDIGFVVYPRLTVLDLAAAWHVISSVPGASCHSIWNRSGPIMADGGLELVTSTSFESCPPLDLLVIPGGPGQQSLMRHVPLMEFLRLRAQSTTWLMGISNGGLLLAQAGLLKGRKATTNADSARLLQALGAEYREEPQVIDGNIATCASAIAALDLSVALIERLAGVQAREQAASAARQSIT